MDCFRVFEKTWKKSSPIALYKCKHLAYTIVMGENLSIIFYYFIDKVVYMCYTKQKNFFIKERVGDITYRMYDKEVDICL